MVMTIDKNEIEIHLEQIQSEPILNSTEEHQDCSSHSGHRVSSKNGQNWFSSTQPSVIQTSDPILGYMSLSICLFYKHLVIALSWYPLLYIPLVNSLIMLQEYVEWQAVVSLIVHEL